MVGTWPKERDRPFTYYNYMTVDDPSGRREHVFRIVEIREPRVGPQSISSIAATYSEGTAKQIVKALNEKVYLNVKESIQERLAAIAARQGRSEQEMAQRLFVRGLIAAEAEERET